MPISVVAKNEAGQVLILRESLLTICLTESVNAEPEALLADVGGQPHTLGWVPLALVGAVVLAFLLLGMVEHWKRK